MKHYRYCYILASLRTYDLWELGVKVLSQEISFLSKWAVLILSFLWTFLHFWPFGPDFKQIFLFILRKTNHKKRSIFCTALTHINLNFCFFGYKNFSQEWHVKTKGKKSWFLCFLNLRCNFLSVCWCIHPTLPRMSHLTDSVRCPLPLAGCTAPPLHIGWVFVWLAAVRSHRHKSPGSQREIPWQILISGRGILWSLSSPILHGMQDKEWTQKVIHLPWLGRIETIHDRCFFSLPLKYFGDGPLFRETISLGSCFMCLNNLTPGNWSSLTWVPFKLVYTLIHTKCTKNASYCPLHISVKRFHASPSFCSRSLQSAFTRPLIVFLCRPLHYKCRLMV